MIKLKELHELKVRKNSFFNHYGNNFFFSSFSFNPNNF